MFFLYLEIGVGLAGFGIAFLFLGVLFLFDKGLLAIGNVRWLTVTQLFTVHVLKKLMISAYNTVILWDI